MSLLPTAMRDPDMQPLGPPLRLAAPPQPDQRAENVAKWFENGQFEIDAETGKHVDADAPERMTGLHDGLDEMLWRAVEGVLGRAVEGVLWGVDFASAATAREVEDFHAAMRGAIDNACGIPPGPLVDMPVPWANLFDVAPSNSEVKDHFKRAALGQIADDERAAFDRRLALRRPLGATL